MAKKVSFDLCENLLPDTKLIYENSNSKDIRKLQNVLIKVIQEQLTKRQSEIMLMYFFEKKNITHISNELNLNKSTVSRSLHASLKKLNQILRYYL